MTQTTRCDFIFVTVSVETTSFLNSLLGLDIREEAADAPV